jgi:ATP-dependent metalloprotease
MEAALQGRRKSIVPRAPGLFRLYSTSVRTNRSLSSLKRDVKADPNDQQRQIMFLRKLHEEQGPDAVVAYVEALQSQHLSEAVLREYLRALAHTLRGREGGTQGAGSEAVTMHGAFGVSPGAPSIDIGAMVGSRQAVHVAMAEPSAKEQVWRTLRTLAIAYLLLLGITTIMEERGLVKGISSGSDMGSTKPAESTKTFADVVGVDEAKTELQEIVSFLRQPERFTRLGGKMTKGVLLTGPPGTGKTLLAKAIAGEAGVPFFYASGSEFEEMYVGVGARRVRELFENAKRKAPCIIFIDEIDAIGASRNPKDQQYMRMTLNQLLAEMDGFNSSHGIIVIAATNFPEVLDKALTRPGRLDRHVVVPNPDVKGRRQILSLHLAKVPCAVNVDMEVLARGTPGFSGAELANLVNVAAIKASNECKKAVDMEDLDFAKDRIIMGAERKSAVITDESRRLTAYHEAGHALVACLTPGALAVHKATVVPRGQALGMVMQLPDSDETSWSRRQMLAKMDVCMGGRVAEELIYGAEHVTSGASSDLEQATEIATSMVERWGMSDKVGFVSHKNLTGRGSEAHVSQQTRAAIDSEVKRLTSQAYDNAKAILRKHEDKLHVLAQELIKQETLTGDQVRHLIGLKEPQRKASPPAGGKGGDKEAGDGCSETKTEGPSAGSNNKAGTGNKPARSWWFGS